MSIRSQSLTALGIIASCWLASGCAVPSAQYPVDEPVSSIAQRLMHALELRTDLGSVRLFLHPFKETPGSDRPTPPRTRPDAVYAIAEELEHAFLVALSERLNLIEPELVIDQTIKLGPNDAQRMALKSTHVLVGNYIRRPYNRLVVSVRIVQTSSSLIVAAAQGVVQLRSY